MTIAKRLMILLAVPLLALLAVAIFTRVQLSKIEKRSRFVAESRIAALATIGNLSRSFAELRIQVRSHLLATNPAQRAAARAAFDAGEQNVTRLLHDYADHLLYSDQGRRLFNEYQILSREWIAGARQIMSVAENGKQEEALALLNASAVGVGDRLGKLSNEWIQNNQELASSAGHDAVEAVEESRSRILVANALFILVTSCLGFLTFRRIVTPIRGLDTAVKTIAGGDFAHAVPFTQAADETGGLARSIDVLKQGAAAMEEQRWVKSNAAKLTGELQGAASLAEFGQRLVSGLMPVLGGGVAGFYLFEEARLRRVSAYGIAEGSAPAESFEFGEGLVGQCAEDLRPVNLDHLPSNYLRIASGLGGAAPTQVVALPLLSKDILLGVLEIATFRPFNATEKKLLEELLPLAAMSLEILQRNLRTQELLAQTREQGEQIKLSEERSRLLLESTAEGIFGVDTDGNTRFVNPAACRLLGFTAEELIGQPSHAIFHHHRPDGSVYPKEECPMFAAYTQGKSSRIDTEFLWRKDGSGFPVEYGATPMIKNGAVLGAVISFTDISERKRAEAELLTQHSALEAAANAIVITDPDGTIQWVNPAFTRLTGYDRAEAIGQNPRVLKSGVQDEEFYRNLWETVLAGSVWRGTLTNKRKDGVLYQEEMTITPVRAKEGKITHFVAVKQDITERLRAEQRLRETEQFFRSVLELAPDGLMVVNARGAIQLANAQCEKLFGYTREELVGQTVEILVPTEVRSGHEKLREAFHRSPAARAMGANLELRGLRKDGSVFPVEIGLSPLPARQSEGAQVAVSIRDITERKRAEAELKKQKDELQQINFKADSALDLTKSGYWHVPLDGSGWYNSSERAVRIFGDPPAPGHRYTLEHWAKQVQLGDEEAAKITAENFAAAVEGKIPVYDATYAYKRPVDGKVVWIHALGHVAKDENGKPTDMFGVTQDITAFKLLEMELVGAKQKAEEATEMKSMFLANMSHEIRTPMNAIIGLSHLALKTPLNPKQRDYVSKVHNAGTSLLAIINDILDFSKIEAGKLGIETTDFQLDEVIGSVTTVTAQKAHDKGLEFLADVAAAIPEQLRGDPLRVGQILTNLVNNAIKFTERGEIRLKIELLEYTGDKVQLKFSVRDTGIGMTREQAAKLFQPFSQADMSTTRKHGGTGLGLTICRRLVELMSGQIWLESEAGVGSTFFFTLWLGVGEAAPKGKSLPSQFQNLRVLVVDDNVAAREILVESLSSLADCVHAVSSGPEALAAIKERDADQPYDVVFMDWRMPGMDGLQATRLVKKDSSLQKQPAVIIVTAFGREEVREEAEQLHVEGFLVKPVTKSMLVDSLVGVFAASTPEGVAAASAQHDSPRLEGMRILLTEDNEINQQIAIELLEGAGAKVDVANNGREAVDKLFRQPIPTPYDIVLMDLQMPEMDGYQATTQIRSDKRFSHLPIVAMTAHATIEERQRCLDAGMNDHVSKPIDPALLFVTLQRFHRPKTASTSGSGSDREPISGPSLAADDGLPVVEGLDVKDGLSRVAGNRKLYLKLLRQFVEQQGAAPAHIKEALANNDASTAERLAHTVKGVCGNLGVRGVQQAAAKLEKSIAAKAEPAALSVALQELSSALEDFVGRLRAALPKTESASEPVVPAASLDPAQARNVIAEMMGHLNNFDPTAGECLEAHRDVFRSVLPAESFAAFEQQVGNFAFADAVAGLHEAAKKKGLLPA